MTVQQMLTNIDSSELTEWVEFFALRGEEDEKKDAEETLDQMKQRVTVGLKRRAEPQTTEGTMVVKLGGNHRVPEGA